MSRKSHLQIGIAAIGFAVFLYLIGIPNGVTAPSNIRNIVLSPLFWPQILTGLLAAVGLGLVLTARNLSDDGHVSLLAGVEGAPLRLAAMAALMIGYVLLTPLLGMVWTSMLAFVLLALLIKTSHPIAAILAGVLALLVLHAFFAHVAGVAIPQGEIVRLP